MSADSCVGFASGAEALPPASLSSRSYVTMWMMGLRLLAAVWLLCGWGSVATWAQGVASLSLVPGQVTGGNSLMGTITLSGAAASNVTVTLTPHLTTFPPPTLPPGSPLINMPSAVTVTQGQTQATFTITTTAVPSPLIGTITAAANGTNAQQGFGVYPAQMQAVNGFTLSPDTTVGGQNVMATIFLDGPAPDGGLTIDLTTSNSAFVALAPATLTGTIQTLPLSITVPAGQSSYSFALATAWANYTQSATVTATLGTQSQSATLTLLGANLRVTDVVGFNTLRLHWEGLTTNGQFLLTRDGTTLTTLNAGVTTYDDVFTGGYESGHTYVYQLWDTSLANAVANHLQISSENVTPYALAASETQAVDSRLDLRYSDVHYLDHCFGTTTYRGGLFAGVAGDASSIGRSFLRFAIPFSNSGSAYLRTGGFAAYCPGIATHTATSVAIGCQVIPNNAWDFSKLVWTATNPDTFNAGAAGATTTISYDPANPQEQWVVWAMPDVIVNALNAATATTPTPLTVALAGANESNTGWVYFGKFGYRSGYLNNPGIGGGLGPRAVYAQAKPVPIAAYCIPNPDGTAYYNIIMNGLNPGDTAGVVLSSMGLGGSTASSRPVSITGLQHVVGAFPTGYTESGQDRNYKWATANGVTVPIQMVNGPTIGLDPIFGGGTATGLGPGG